MSAMFDRFRGNDSSAPVQRIKLPPTFWRPLGWGLLLLVLVYVAWPFYSVPTGSRGVVTQFGKIVGIEGEGLALLPPWQKLSNFSIRAEQAQVENATSRF